MRISLLLLYILGCAQCSRILVLFPFGTLSHKISFYPAIAELAARGHDITVVTMFASKEKLPNVREIVLPLKINEKDGGQLFSFRHVPTALAHLVSFFKIGEMTEPAFKVMMESEEFLEVLRKKEVDLVLVDSIVNDFCMPIINELNVPFILVSSSNAVPWHSRALGATANLAAVPHAMSSYGTEMTFLQRVNNVILHNAIVWGRHLILLPRIESYTRKHFPDYTSIADIEKKASLLMISTNAAHTWQKPLPPNVVDVGVLHCRPPKPLPADLQRIADDSSEHGFIVFTLGSIIKGTSIPKEYLNAFIKAFEKIPQKVIWKWESDSLQVSPNVHLVKWLPQQDLLGHRNAKLFLSHGGLLGIQEAIYHGVPLLGLPIANDQYGNIGKVVSEGMAIKLEWNDVTEDALVDAITSLVNNSSYKENARRLSGILRDTLVSGPEIVAYWVEYVLRHKGAAHLRPPNSDLAWYQYYLLDVAIFLSLCAGLECIVVVYICKRIYGFCSKKKCDKKKLKRN